MCRNYKCFLLLFLPFLGYVVMPTKILCGQDDQPTVEDEEDDDDEDDDDDDDKDDDEAEGKFIVNVFPSASPL